MMLGACFSSAFVAKYLWPVAFHSKAFVTQFGGVQWPFKAPLTQTRQQHLEGGKLPPAPDYDLESSWFFRSTSKP